MLVSERWKASESGQGIFEGIGSTDAHSENVERGEQQGKGTREGERQREGETCSEGTETHHWIEWKREFIEFECKPFPKIIEKFQHDDKSTKLSREVSKELAEKVAGPKPPKEENGKEKEREKEKSLTKERKRIAVPHENVSEIRFQQSI